MLPGAAPGDAAALIAVTKATAFRSMHGTWTRLSTGPQVRPGLCSIPIPAAFPPRRRPPRTSASALAAIERAIPAGQAQRAVPADAHRLDLRQQAGQAGI